MEALFVSRGGGWWGLAFVVGLLLEAAMVSLPTAARSGEEIAAFYAAHRQVIVVQQVAGMLLLVPFVGLAAKLERRNRTRVGHGNRWLVPAVLFFVVTELATNVTPLALAAISDPSPGTAHTLTLVEDLADGALFVAIAIFSGAAVAAAPLWLRLIGLLAAGLGVLRAVTSPLGMSAFDTVAPIAFLVLVLVMSVRLLLAGRGSQRVVAVG